MESNQRCDLKDGAGSFDLGDGFVGGLVSGKMITTDLCGECLQYFPRQLDRTPKKISGELILRIFFQQRVMDRVLTLICKSPLTQ